MFNAVPTLVDTTNIFLDDCVYYYNSNYVNKLKQGSSCSIPLRIAPITPLINWTNFIKKCMINISGNIIATLMGIGR